MYPIKFRSAPFLALLMIVVVGCAGTSTRESTGEYIDDTWITTKVKAALVEDSVVKASEVNVETFKGIVQLSGFVTSKEAMDQAMVLAANVDGVSSVRNDMRIK
ncbi:MAG: BON domain-containing protein [Pseudomonadales bacterium]